MQTEQELKTLKDNIHAQAALVTEWKQATNADQLVMNSLTAKIQHAEEGLKERKQISEDFFHKDKAEAMLSEYRELQVTAKEEVAELEIKRLKVEAASRRGITQAAKKESKLKHQVKLAEVYLKHRTNELRALKLTER